MATRFLQLFGVQKPTKVPVVRHEESNIARHAELNGIPPEPSIPVPNYAALKQPTVAVKRNRPAYRGVQNPRGISIEPTTEYIYYVTDIENMQIHILSHTGEGIKQF